MHETNVNVFSIKSSEQLHEFYAKQRSQQKFLKILYSENIPVIFDNYLFFKNPFKSLRCQYTSD